MEHRPAPPLRRHEDLDPQASDERYAHICAWFLGFFFALVKPAHYTFFGRGSHVLTSTLWLAPFPPRLEADFTQRFLVIFNTPTEGMCETCPLNARCAQESGGGSPPAAHMSVGSSHAVA